MLMPNDKSPRPRANNLPLASATQTESTLNPLRPTSMTKSSSSRRSSLARRRKAVLRKASPERSTNARRLTLALIESAVSVLREMLALMSPNATCEALNSPGVESSDSTS